MGKVRVTEACHLTGDAGECAYAVMNVFVFAVVCYRCLINTIVGPGLCAPPPPPGPVVVFESLMLS